MQIPKRFLPLVAITLTAFFTASLLRAQGGNNSSATPSPDVRSVLQADSASSSYVGDPFAKLFARQADDAAAAGGYPASPQMGSSSSSWAPAHFEIQGIAQWKNLNQNVNLSATCVGTTCPLTGTGFNLSKDLGLSGQTPGPLVRFLWMPERKILGATSLVRVEWSETTRTKNHTTTTEIDIGDVVFPAGTTLQAQLKNRSFELAYAPEWGNDKFRIGPMFVYQHLGVDVILKNLTPGAPPPTNVSVNVPNNIFQLGLDFEYTPVKEINAYGHAGFIPCCGGGWHEADTEFGLKYYLARSFSIIGGVRYTYLKRDFAGSITEDSTTVAANGSLKWPGVGPFVGATFRF